MRTIELGLVAMTVMLVAACGSTNSGTGGSGGTAGAGGSGGSGGDSAAPVDQCINDSDMAVYDDLGDAVGEIAADCPLPSCGGQVGSIIGGDTSEGAITALSDCVAQCVQDGTAEQSPPGLSAGCSSCYGLITACAIGTCLEPCAPPNSGSQECAQCSLDNCGFFDDCLGI